MSTLAMGAARNLMWNDGRSDLHFYRKKKTSIFVPASDCFVLTFEENKLEVDGKG